MNNSMTMSGLMAEQLLKRSYIANEQSGEEIERESTYLKESPTGAVITLNDINILSRRQSVRYLISGDVIVINTRSKALENKYVAERALVIPSQEKSEKKEKLKKSADKLMDRIAASFGITTKVDIAKILNITPQALYSRLKGAMPNKDSIERSIQLMKIMSEWDARGYSLYPQFIKEKVYKEKSVYDLLCEKKLDRDKIIFAGQKMQNIGEPDIDD